MFTSIIITCKTTWKVNKYYLLYEVLYNLLKQFFNVFYGVYFLRTLLAYLDSEMEIRSIMLLLIFMLLVNITFYSVDNHLKQVYVKCFEQRLKFHVHENIFKQSTTVSYEHFHSTEYLNTYHRVLENTTEQMLILLKSLGTVCGLFLALGLVLIYLFQIDLAAIFLCLLPLIYSYFVGNCSEKSKHKLNQAVATDNRKKNYVQRVFYLPQYAKELKMTPAASLVKTIYQEASDNIIAKQKQYGRKVVLFSFIELCIGDVLIVMLPIIYVAVRILSGTHLLIGDFVGIAQAIATFSWDIEWLFDMFLQIRASSLYIQEYAAFIAPEAKTVTHKSEYSLPDSDRNWILTCKNGSYTYPDGTLALHDLYFSICKGEKIAIVGENGAGKTTLASALVNLITLNEGPIRLNGIELHCYDREQLKNFFGIVEQDFHIYPLTVRENLSVNGVLPDDILWNAIDKMGLSHKIQSLDCFMTHELSENGLELSGGQAQRLALARIIANDYPFVLLDEPTSALDPITERDIDRLLLDVVKDRTVVIISHRMATTRMVDRSLVMKDGTIVENGNHQQLMEQKGTYWNMYTAHQELYRGVFDE